MVLHHVEDAAAALHCLAGLLQQGGRLVLTDLLQTERSKAFHGVKAHHTVSHAGEDVGLVEFGYAITASGACRVT
jgi:2-polyprenyl-3-methyl-5-hydroxy-6-metoxy-1,4-benzoquinol methylase